MVNQPRRRRSTAPVAAAPAQPSAQSSSPEWRLRLALALLFISSLSALFNLIAVLALGTAIAHLGAPQGPLEFALVFVGAVVGLGGDAVIVTGTLAVIRPGTRFSGHPERVTWGLGLQLLASGLVGLLESSWTFAVIYLLLLAGLAYLWIRTSPGEPVRPVARHPAPGGQRRPVQQPLDERSPIPWVGSAPPPPSSAGTAWGRTPGPPEGSEPEQGPSRGRQF